jgi:cholesterol transport system auxiliary component
MIGRLKKLSVLTGLLVVVASCSSIVDLPNSGDAPSLYNLTALDNPRGTGNSTMLMIEDPTVVGGLDLNHIARRSSPNELQYFAKARWNSRISRMVQTVLAESIEQTGQNVSTGRGGAVVPPKYELQLNIRDFQAEYYNGATRPEIRVRMAAKLVQMAPLKVVGQQVFEARYTVGSDAMGDIIDGFDTANRNVMAEVIAWSLPLVEAQ